MIIDVVLFPQNLVEYDIRQRLVVVVDIFRATSTIITAIKNGAQEVVPFIKTEQVGEAAQNYPADRVLKCGERKGYKFSGFDLGNSPAEYSREAIHNKILLFSSTNGSRVFFKVRSAREIVVGGFVNINNVVERIAERKEDVVIACAGHYGQISLEDTVCAGMILAKLKEREEIAEISDEAGTSIILYQYYMDDFHSLVRDSSHGRYLSSIGKQDDMEYCLTVNKIDCLPVYNKKSIVKNAAEK